MSSMAPPRPTTSISRNAAGGGEAEQGGDGGETARRADYGQCLRRHVPLPEAYGQHG